MKISRNVPKVRLNLRQTFLTFKSWPLTNLNRVFERGVLHCRADRSRLCADHTKDLMDGQPVKYARAAHHDVRMGLYRERGLSIN